LVLFFVSDITSEVRF